MIDIKDLRFQYSPHSFRLQIDELHVAVGSRVAIVGPSGSGKTTLLNLLSGIVPCQSGRVQVAGQNLAAMNDRQRRDFRSTHIGFVFQQFELIPYLRLIDNILLPYFINPTLKLTAEVRNRAKQLAARVGVEDKLHRFMHQLSQGEQQRVALCRSLINRPGLVLADEPTGNLDVVNKKKVLQILFEQASEQQQTLIVVTHDTGILDGFDRVVDFAEFCSAGGSA